MAIPNLGTSHMDYVYFDRQQVTATVRYERICSVDFPISDAVSSQVQMGGGGLKFVETNRPVGRVGGQISATLSVITQATYEASFPRACLIDSLLPTP